MNAANYRSAPGALSAPSPAMLDRAGALWPLTRKAHWIANPVVAALYSGVAALSLMVAIPPGYASALWPPAGIALAAWLGLGARIWPGIFVGAILANLSVMGTPVLVALAIGTGNTAEAALAGLLIGRFVGLRHRFEHPAAVWKFAAIAFGASLVAATNGVLTLALAGQVPWAEFGTHWLTWWLGDATGIIIVTPLLLCWSEPAAARAPGDKRIEYQLFAALLVLCAALVSAVNFAKDAVQTLAYLLIPFVTWAASRLDQRAVTAASFAISAVAVMDMLDGAASMFAPLSLNASLLLLQLFVSAVAVTGLILSALAGELSRMNVQLEASHGDLRRTVKGLGEDLKRTLAQQRLLAQRMVKVRDEERERLAADLHDSVGQDLSSLNISLDLMGRQIAAKTSTGFAERIEQARAIAMRAGKSLRSVISGMRPRGVEELGLSSALRQQAAAFESRTGILVTVVAMPGRESAGTEVKDVLVRIFLEALTNVAKHADANVVRVTLETKLHRLELGVEDDGRGFDNTASRARDANAGSGLLIMRERAVAVGAEFKVRSTPGVGTRIEVSVPL